MEQKINSGIIRDLTDINTLRYGLATGIIEGGALSTNVGDNSLLDIGAGKSLYVDFTDADVPVIEVLLWNAQTVDPNLSGSISRLWVGVQRLSSGVGELVFSIEFTALERRTIAILGRCWSNASAPTIIEGVGQYSTPAFNGYKALTDLIDVIGSLNRDGNVFVPNGANLLLNKSNGHSFRFSANFLNSPTSPHIHDDTTMTGITAYHYHYYAYNTTDLKTTIDPEYYDVAGVKTAVPSGKFTVQRVYYFPKSQVIDIIYGQALYDTLIDAESRSDVEAVQIDEANINTLRGSILRAYICVQQGCTTLNNTSQCSILGVSNFGAGAAGGGTILSVAGSDGQIQYNQGGILAATINMEWNEAASCLNIGQSTILPDNPFAATADAESYAQVNFRNTNSLGSIDLVFTADDGTDTIKYGDIGFCNSEYYSVEWDLFQPYDMYYFAEQGDCFLGTLDGTKSVKVFIPSVDGEAHPSDVVATINNDGINLPSGSQFMINNVAVGGVPGFTSDVIGVVVDGSGAVLTTGSKGYREISEDCTITGWTIIGKESGSCVIDVKRSTYATFPTFTTIAGSEKPTLSSSQKNQDVSLSSWTVDLVAGDILEFVIDSVSTITKVTLSIKIIK